MPVYDMTCDACGHAFDVEQGMNDPLPKKCPQCGKMKLRRAFSKPPAFHTAYSPMHPRVNRGRGY